VVGGGVQWNEAKHGVHERAESGAARMSMIRLQADHANRGLGVGGLDGRCARAHGDDAQAGCAAPLDRAFATDAPGVKALQSLLDDARGRVLGDQLLATKAVIRGATQIQDRRIPPHYRVAIRVIEVVETRADASERNRRFAIEQAILAEGWTPRCRDLLAAA